MASPFKHPSTGFYYFRRAIPTDLLPHFSGKREFKKSLQTKCVTEAKSRFAKQAADFEQLCENIRLQIRDAGVRDVTSSAAHFINRREEQYRQAADLPRELHAARALAKLMPRTQGDSPDAAPAAHKVAHRQRATWVEEFAQRLHLFGVGAAYVSHADEIDTQTVVSLGASLGMIGHQGAQELDDHRLRLRMLKVSQTRGTFLL